MPAKKPEKSKTAEKIRSLLAEYSTPARRSSAPRKPTSPNPKFKLGQSVFIGKLQQTGVISAVHGFDPFIGETIYDIKLDHSGKEVQWTEKRLTPVDPRRQGFKW